jgi:hypothetical protein
VTVLRSAAWLVIAIAGLAVLLTLAALWLVGAFLYGVARLIAR